MPLRRSKDIRYCGPGISSDDYYHHLDVEGSLSPALPSSRRSSPLLRNEARSVTPKRSTPDARETTPPPPAIPAKDIMKGPLPPAKVTSMASGSYSPVSYRGDAPPFDVLSSGTSAYHAAVGREGNGYGYSNGNGVKGNSPYLHNHPAGPAAQTSQSTLILESNGSRMMDPRSSSQSIRTVDSTATARTLTKRLLAPLGGSGASSYNGSLRHQRSFNRGPSSIAETEFSVAPSTTSTVASGKAAPLVYGYTPLGWDVELDSGRVAQLIEVCGEQIRQRGE